MKYIDLRSDTVTLPTDEMRHAMSLAEVGDDVYEDDRTVQKLEELAAHMLGYEAALFTPSGTMANQLAIMGYTNRGDEIIVSADAHIVAHEVGAVSVLSGANMRTINSAIMRGSEVKNAIRGDDIHYPKTALICLENALGNGQVVPLDIMEEVYEVAKANSIPVHLDGARLFNAAVYLGVDAKEITKYADSTMFCLSKGLCAPVGSMLCGSAEFIKKARKNRKLLGGGMRQAGILAAAGIIALEKMTKRLHIDHENAKYLAEKLDQIPSIDINADNVHINMVFFNIKSQIDDKKVAAYLFEQGIKINPPDKGVCRVVVHNDISREDIDKFIEILKECVDNV